MDLEKEYEDLAKKMSEKTANQITTAINDFAEKHEIEKVGDITKTLLDLKEVTGDKNLAEYIKNLNELANKNATDIKMGVQKQLEDQSFKDLVSKSF